jgi:hypothetical protein
MVAAMVGTKGILPLIDASLPPIEASTATCALRTDDTMKPHLLAFSALILALSLTSPGVVAQGPALEETALNSPAVPLHAERDGSSSAAFVIPSPRPLGATRTYRPFSGLGLATRVGFAGTGFDVATPLATRFNLRAGSDFFRYSPAFRKREPMLA